MDKVKLSDVRAKFPMYADIPDYQLLGALHKQYYSDIPREQFLTTIDFDTSRPDPTKDMSTGQRVLAGVGSGMAGVGRALGLGGALGLDNSERAQQLDAPLKATTAGNVGSAIGTAALAAPTAFIPGANTYLGAALIGAGTGAAFTEGDLAERLKGAGYGAAGGAAGKGLGDLIGAGASKLAQSMAAKRTTAELANAQKDAAAVAAKEAGYVIPPADVRSNMLNEMLGGFSGKIKTAQVASQKNQEVTNALARKALGIADGSALDTGALDALRKNAGQAYRDVADIGQLDVTGKTIPAGVKVSEANSPLMFGKTKSVDTADLVQSWRQANADATAYFRSYARTADPEALTKARTAAAAAKQLDELITSAASPAQKEALDQARRLIAKSYSVEKALNAETGDVSAQALAAQLKKGKPLSGDLLTAARVGSAFPKATQSLKEAPKAVSPLDFMAGLMTAGSTGPLGAAAIGARPLARSLLLSKPYQAAMANPRTYGRGLLESSLAGLDDEALRRALTTSGGLLGSNFAQ